MAEKQKKDVEPYSPEDIAAMKVSYPEYTTEPTYDVSNHEEKSYIRSLLVWRENTEYYPTTEEKYEVCYIIPAQVMVQVIVQNAYDVIIPNKNKPENRILCPKSVNDMYVAEGEVQKYAPNAKIGTFYKKFPYYPMQHDLPVVRMLDEDHSFRDWKAHTPTQEDWRAFVYAPTNIRYLKATYCANCRHKTGAWDEHPWCAACLVKAGIKPCAHPDEETDDPCYICAKMTREAVIAFLKRVEEWSKPDEKGNMRKPKARKLPTKIKCQVQADLATAPDAEHDMNPAWAKNKRGICRPATVIPMYGLIEDVLKYSNNQRAAAVKRHMRFFKQRYTEDRAYYGEDNPAWPDIKLFEAMGNATEQQDSDNADEVVISADERGSGADADADAEDEEVAPDPKSQQKPKGKQKSKRSPVRRNETKLQRHQRMNREKDKHIASLQRDIAKLKKEMNELKQSKPKNKEKTWKGLSAACTVPISNMYRAYDYNKALQAAARMSEDVKFISAENEPSAKKRKIMHRSLLTSKKKHFVADEDILEKVDKVLDDYAENPYNPEFELSIDVCLADFSPSKILAEPPPTEPDMNGKRPGDEDEVLMTQKEIIRLDALNRAMIKIHETEEAFVSALLDKMDISEISEDKEPDEAVVLEAMRQNHLCKEDLIAESTAIVIAARRRDNVMRQNVPDHHKAAIVAHPILPKEKALIMRDREPQPGQGPSHSRHGSRGHSQTK